MKRELTITDDGVISKHTFEQNDKIVLLKLGLIENTLATSLSEEEAKVTGDLIRAGVVSFEGDSYQVTPLGHEYLQLL